MTPKSLPRPSYDFIGGNICLDFVNTVGGLRGQVSKEYINDYADLVDWALQAKVISVDTAEALRRAASSQAKDAHRAFVAALAVREAIYDIFSAVAGSNAVPAESLAIINGEILGALGHMRLTAERKKFEWRLATDVLDLKLPIWAVARATLELLTSDQLDRVRECSGDLCGWLFLDTTRNHSRLWCDMRGCGNRAKVRRHRERLNN